MTPSRSSGAHRLRQLYSHTKTHQRLTGDTDLVDDLLRSRSLGRVDVQTPRQDAPQRLRTALRNGQGVLAGLHAPREVLHAVDLDVVVGVGLALRQDLPHRDSVAPDV